MTPIEEHVLTFVTQWNEITKYQRAYQLDHSWPSITLLDYILRPIGDKTSEIEVEDIQKINACAGYLANLLAFTWLQSPKQPVVEIVMNDVSQLSVTITAKEQESDDLLFQLNLSKTICETIREKQQPFEFFPLTARYLPEFYPRIALLSTALLLGIHPKAAGAWSKDGEPLDDEKRELINKLLAKSTAAHYASRFPEEFIGAQQNFYDGAFLFPPAMHLEPYPYTRATLTAMHRLIEQVSSIDEVISFAQNATRTADDILSHTGLTILIAAMEEADAHLLLNIQAREDYIALLYPAINIARQKLNKHFSWFAHALSAKSDNDSGKFEIAEQLLADEFNLGLIPHLRLPANYLRNEIGFIAINAIYLGKFDDAIKALQSQIDSDDNLLKAQLAYLQLFLDRPIQARQTLLKIDDPNLHTYQECNALMLCKTQGAEIALPFIEALLEEMPAGVMSRTIEKQMFIHYVIENQFEQLLKATEASLNKAVSLQAMLFKSEALYRLEKGTEADEIMSYLRKTVPFQWNVFSRSLKENF